MIFTTAKQRFHDESATGALRSVGQAPKARVSSLASYYDPADRLTDIVDVGTYGGAAYSREVPAPTSSNEKHRTQYVYGAAGWVTEVIDPRGIPSRTAYDMLGRVTETIENYNDGTPGSTGGGGAIEDRKTTFAYNGSDQLTFLTAHLTSSTSEQTAYVYGVDSSTGSDVVSNELLWKVKYPDKSSNSPSEASADQEIFDYNAVADVKELTDRNQTTRQFVYDTLGRLTTDKVTTLGSGVNNSVLRMDVAYDQAGRPFRFTSCNSASSCTGGNIANQVETAFNGLGQLTTEYQSHSGAGEKRGRESLSYL